MRVCVCECVLVKKVFIDVLDILNGLYDLKRWDMGKPLTEQWVDPVLLSLLDYKHPQQTIYIGYMIIPHT